MVYKAFVLRKRQELEKRVEAERQRAEAAEKRIEELTAKLRAAGMEP